MAAKRVEYTQKGMSRQNAETSLFLLIIKELKAQAA